MPQSQSRKRKLKENDCDFYAKVLIPSSELNCYHVCDNSLAFEGCHYSLIFFLFVFDIYCSIQGTVCMYKICISVSLQCGRPGFDPWVGKIPRRRKGQPTSVFLPGKFHGGRSLVGYSPWGRRELDTTE